MDTISSTDPMEKPPQPPLSGLNPADLLKQGLAQDTITGGPQSGSFEPPPLEELALIFPQFEILGLIGKGGMGAVYKVRQKDLDRIVALKILPPAIGQSPAFASRFTREAKALAKLNHPGIVTIYEFGQADGLYFFLMEFVDGVNLAQLMRSGRVSPREALAIDPQICEALQFAHDQGIVHRDIKPENILLDRLGRVKVADFGIAKVVEAVCDRQGSGEAPRSPADATLAGKIMGTPQYMAPEQIEHPSEVDHRADIYALGVVFYQLLTGELPGKQIEAPSQKVRIDVRLDEIVLRAMEKDPELRFQQASVMKTRLDDLGAQPAPHPDPVPAKRTEPFAITSLVLGLFSIALGPLGAIPAIVFGHLSRARIRKNAALEGRGFALSGIILGWAFLALYITVTTVVMNRYFSLKRNPDLETWGGRDSTVIAKYDWAQLAAEGRISGSVPVEMDGRSTLKIENLNDAPLRVTLLKIETPPITSQSYALGGEIRYEGLQGSAYLEMWSEFPEGRFFSRTLGAPGSGPMSQLTGTSGWREFTLPFDRNGTAKPPSQLEMNVFLPGRGTVFVGPLKLTESTKR
jgi:serine/threonine protein kinase